MSFTDKKPRNKKILYALLTVFIMQIGACSYIGGDEFWIIPLLCSAPKGEGFIEIYAYIYVTALLLNLFVLIFGFVNSSLTRFSLIFSILLLIGIFLQIYFLEIGLLFCDGP